jgi:uncharacterized protein (TIGR03000 family)
MYSVVLVMALAGSAEVPDCHRCCGCYGGGYGCYGGCYGGYSGCYGGCYGGSYGGCYGGCYGGGMYYGGGGMQAPVEKLKAPMTDKEVAAPANIVVRLPAGAKLSIDGYVSNQTSTTRYLQTPTLQPGQVYAYTMVAETTQNGQPVQLTQRVSVRAGQTTPVSFSFSNAPAAASR